MKVYELAKALKRESKDLCKEYELKSHLSNVPEDLVAELIGDEKKNTTEPEPTQTIDSAETVIVKEELKELELPDGVTAEKVWLSCHIAANKSPFWDIRELGKRPERK